MFNKKLTTILLCTLIIASNLVFSQTIVKASGTTAVGWKQIGGTWYYLNSNGAMETGWIQSGSKWYFLNSDGAMATSWIQSGGAWYYLNSSGEMATGWIQSGGKWYFLNSGGAMATGWIQVGGAWYYLNSSGEMASNTTVDGSTLGSDGTIQDDKPTSVSLNKTADVLTVGGTDTLISSVLPAALINQSVTWTSSNTAIATVDSTGDVSAVSAGTATIIVTTIDGSKTASCTVNVANPVTTVSLNKTTDVLTVGGTDTLIAGISPTTATNQAVTWTSSNTAIVSVDNTGKVTAISTGNAVITVTTTDGSKTASCMVSATNPIVTGWIQTEGTWYYLNSSGEMATGWIQSGGKWYFLNSGGAMATGWIQVGGAWYYLNSSGEMASNTTVDGSTLGSDGTIQDDKPTSVSLNKTADVLTVGGTDTLISSVLPAALINQSVTWTSSNTAIATVDSTGDVSAVSAGTATIIVTTIDGSKTASCTVSVTNPVTTVSLNKTTDVLTVGGTDTLIAGILPTTATNQAVTWTSSNTAIVSVDNTGKVTAISAGNAVITAITADGKENVTCNVTAFNPGPGHMLISNSLVNFTANYEGYSANSYVGLDSQNYTIGYGHVILSGENYTNLTKPQAWDLLKQDLQNTGNNVRSFTSDINLSQQQFDALVDLSYNCGVNGLQNSTLLKDIKAGASIDILKNDFLMWVYCNGTPLINLYQRRTDEWQMYTSGNYTRDYPVAPNGYS